MAFTYSDAVMGLGTLIAIAATAGLMRSSIERIIGVADPLTQVILGVFLPLLMIAFLFSLAAAART